MNKFIQKLIKEQFNIGNMNLNNKLKRNANIFNKNYIHPYYYNVLDGTVVESEIKELDSFVSVAAPKDKDELRKIIEFYSENYPEDSLNWLDVSEITDMSGLFSGTFNNKNKYNGDISKWDTSNVTDMNDMFNWACKFNQPIGRWDVSNVTNMASMFCGASEFNQGLSRWDVSNVTDMSHMFMNAERFKQPIGKWDISNVNNISFMFCNAKRFNQPIGDWDISNASNDVIHMLYVFKDARKFNQDLSKWKINSKIIYKNVYNGMFENCPIEEKNKPAYIKI